jgi:hypothetical protein
MQEYPAGGHPRRRSFAERMLGAAMLDVSVYEEVEHDQSATGQAAGVVAIVAACAALGQIGHGGRGIAGALVTAFMAWLIVSALTYFVGTRLFGGTADMGEMLRTIGFAQAPGVLLIAAGLPLIGALVALAVGVWRMVTSVVAIRQAMDFDTGKAIATSIIAWLVVWGLVIAMAVFVFGAILTGAMITR